MTTGKPLWLIGRDIARSPSPAMHNAALATMGMAPRYTSRACSPDELAAVLDEAERTCRGINVTAPHKVRVAERYHDVLDDDARAAGAVNTVVFDDGGKAEHAGNTDVAGLVFAWRRSNFHIEGRTLAIVGAGGAARAVVVAAQQAGARGVVVHARKMSAAVGLVNVATALGLDAVALDENAREPLGATVVVIAASALDAPGVWLERALSGPGAVHDLRYGAPARPVRDAALARGHVFSDGTLMLLAQAQVALQRFTGAPLGDEATAAMRKALTSSLATT
jgi:shikimate dehydrogenase